jgi:hypothetical protein
MTNPNKRPDIDSRQEAWLRLRGCMKDIFAELGGGEAFLFKEREEFSRGMERREALIAEAMSLSPDEADGKRD